MTPKFIQYNAQNLSIYQVLMCRIATFHGGDINSGEPDAISMSDFGH